MSPSMIILLVQTLGPIILPLVTAGATWVFNALMGTLNPKVQKQIKPFLPIVSASFGAAIATLSGASVSEGVVGGLAGTGIHQTVTQITKAKGK